MTPDQEAHLQSIKDRFTAALEEKYSRGQREHGGNMWLRGAEAQVHDAYDEVLDLAVYIHTLHDDIQLLLARIRELESRGNNDD